MTFNSLFDRLIAPIERLVASLSHPDRREHTAIIVLCIYVAIWALYGAIAKSSQDIHPDMAELVTWSRELALGYPKHPPLASWIVAAWFAIFPLADWSFYLLGIANAGVALWIAWRIARDYLAPERRVLGLALLMLIPFFNFHALKFNHNTLLMPLWGVTTLCFLRSFEHRSMQWAALAGLSAAAAMYGKYWSIFLLAGLGVAALLDTRRAAYFKSAAPWVTIGVGTVLIVPHVAWFFANDFAPFFYAIETHSSSQISSFRDAGQYLIGSAAYIALPVFLALAVIRPAPAALRDLLWPAEPRRRLVAVAFWAALILPALATPFFKSGMSAIWSMSAWTLLPIIMLSSPLVSIHHRAMLTAVAIAVFLPIIATLAAPEVAAAIHRGYPDSTSTHSSLLAQRVDREWKAITHEPLHFVAGDDDLADGVAFYLASRPVALENPRLKISPWVLDTQRLRHDGLAIVCHSHDVQCVRPATDKFNRNRPIAVEIVRTHRGVPGLPKQYTIIIQPPAP